MNKDFELIPHTADLQIRVYGTTIFELFRNALIGMFQSIGPRGKKCRREGERMICASLPIVRKVVSRAPDQEQLLVDFLSQALALSDIYNEAYLDATIEKLTNTAIEATVHGIKVEGFEITEIKAVTYHDLKIKQTNDGWQVDIVFDI